MTYPGWAPGQHGWRLLARGTEGFLLAARAPLLFYFLYSSLISSPIMPALSLPCRARRRISHHRSPGARRNIPTRRPASPAALRKPIGQPPSSSDLISTIVPRAYSARLYVPTGCHQRLRHARASASPPFAEFPGLCNIFRSQENKSIDLMSF